MLPPRGGYSMHNTWSKMLGTLLLRMVTAQPAEMVQGLLGDV
jgi:hypothetical protein